MTGSAMEPGPNQIRVRQSRVRVITPEGDSLASVLSGRQVMPEPVEIEGMGRVGFPPPFFVGPGIRYFPGQGLLSYHGVEPELTWYDLDGRPTLRIRLDLKPLPVTEEDRQNYLDGLSEEPPGTPAAYTKARRESAEFPDHMPYYQIVQVDDAGYIWLEHVTSVRETDLDAWQDYRMLSPQGEYLADVPLPAAPFTIARGRLHTLSVNEETGDHELVVYRIEPVAPGFEY